MDTTKIKYVQTIGIHRMFSNVATFSETNKSISSTSTKTKIDFFFTFVAIFSSLLLSGG
jgi:hypothetical protein